MGRPKGKSHEPNTGSGSSSYPSSSHSPAPAGSGMPSASSSAFTSTIVDKNHSDLHKELFTFIRDIQDERSRGEHNLMNISKTHERLQQEVKSKYNMVYILCLYMQFMLVSILVNF